MQSVCVEHVSKRYRLGAISGATLKEDWLRVWARIRGQPDPLSIFGQTRRSSTGGETFWALRDVSFTVREGEVVGIIGRNGAGKSTLLKILAQVTAPTSGSAKIRGRVASLLEVGTGFHPDLTGRENIFLNGAILGMTQGEIRRKLDEIIAFSGIEEFIDTPVKRYSSGMYVRLAFAVAAHLEPEVLIVDEVLAVGDAEFQQKCVGKMEDVAKSGRTVLFVSHNMQAIATLSSRVLYLVDGTVAFAGSTAEGINRYLMASRDDRLTYLDERPAAESPYVQQVRLRTSQDGNVQTNGDPMQIELLIWTPSAVRDACLSVQVFDAHGINYMHVWAHDAKMPMCRERGLHRIVCRIPRLHLYMGHYRLRVFLTQPPGGESFQTLEGICPFQVVMPEVHRLFMWYPNECAYLEEAAWQATVVSSSKESELPLAPALP